MTVINKLNQTLELLKSAESNFRTFSLDTQDQNAKQMYSQLADSTLQSVNTLQSRINFVMSEEPQYQPQKPKVPIQNLENS
ncbi:DUF1657 domain-containing protein [Clostridium botulinum C]|uniref:DUF1657 domain-containing protein n=3 Tax=Clostridium botulinum TaxID=1491 RepID=A0A9Q4TFL4_CLOBO|nr:MULTISPECIES: DUF1657 domain-containing protein [Clostridium]EGO88450.1 hypothetical protein CBCST_05393 [Clostridium botulinum C str. Stockholm]AYF53854.1 DUF1657 domain-containing protein [Clostridium novyi]EES92045.1 conserved domain protein [Clostridium botulinum D str. 1873]KEI09995.1 hypothetical protein Z957_03385 [Clostridium sp. K25]MBO3442597.1 DUF1657 domain-containing protein [Clostridium haemolyticum]